MSLRRRNVCEGLNSGISPRSVPEIMERIKTRLEHDGTLPAKP